MTAIVTKKTNLLDPKNDYVFKRIFGYVGNEEITKELINSIIDKPIKNLTLDCKEILEQDLKSDKFGILDIRAVLDDNIQCDIEMQIVDRKDIENRLLFYWSRMYSKTISIGKNYISAKQSIVILFTNYKIPNLKKIQKYLSKWHICEDEYKNIILTKNFEIYIIEIPKYELYGKENMQLDTWVNFITNPEVINMNENNKAIKQAKKILEEISADEKEQYLAEQRLLYIMDQKAIEAAGYDKGFEKGLEQGIKQSLEDKKKIAKKLLKNNISIDIIVSSTGLTKEEIEKL